MPSVTRSSQGSRAQRRAEMRDRLLAVTEQLLADGDSFTELSVERLVSAAKISRSTFYVYFEDKGDLLRAWFGQIIGQLVDAAAPWWRLESAPTREELRAILAQIILTYRPHTMLMAAVYDTASYDAAVNEEVRRMMDDNTAALRAHIRRGQKAGWIDPELPAAETAAWLTWMAERGQHQMIRGASDEEVGRLVDGYTDVVYNTLYAHAGAQA